MHGKILKLLCTNVHLNKLACYLSVKDSLVRLKCSLHERVSKFHFLKRTHRARVNITVIGFETLLHFVHFEEWVLCAKPRSEARKLRSQRRSTDQINALGVCLSGSITGLIFKTLHFKTFSFSSRLFGNRAIKCLSTYYFICELLSLEYIPKPLCCVELVSNCLPAIKAIMVYLRNFKIAIMQRKSIRFSSIVLIKPITLN